jgi:hypothetical protein
MSNEPKSAHLNMELVGIPGASLAVSRVAISTWAIGAWRWAGSEEKESIDTIRAHQPRRNGNGQDCGRPVR